MSKEHFQYAKGIAILAIILSFCLLAIKQLPGIRAQTYYVLTTLNLLLKSGTAAGIILITSAWNPFKNIIMWIGSISYSLYLVHGYFIGIIGDNQFGNYYINSFEMLTLSFVAAIGLNELVKMLRKWKEKHYDIKGTSN